MKEKKDGPDDEQAPKNETYNWFRAVIITVLLGFFFIFVIGMVMLGSILGDGYSNAFGNIAVINIDNVITTTGSASILSDSGLSSDDYVKLIDDAASDDSIKAIIFMINSPGGSPVGSDEIAQAIKASNKTTVAVIREVGASGAYWIASACDHIIANRMSIVGSIGVTSSHLGFEGFLTDHNVTYRRLVTGEFKDIGTPFKEMTEKEKAEIKKRMMVIHNFFIDEVSKNRNLPRESVENIATGLYWTGSESKDLGLVDELGGMDEAVGYIEANLNIKGEPVHMFKSTGFGDLFSTTISGYFYRVGQGIGSSLFQNTGPSLHI